MVCRDSIEAGPVHDTIYGVVICENNDSVSVRIQQCSQLLATSDQVGHLQF